MTEMEAIAEMKIVVKVEDKANGDIMVKYDDVQNLYIVTFELDAFGGAYEEKHSTHGSLSLAMSEVADMIKLNVEHNFYDEDL